MTEIRRTRLPGAADEYDPVNEQGARRQIENALSQLSADLHQIATCRDIRICTAVKRHNFLYMGGPDG